MPERTNMSSRKEEVYQLLKNRDYDSLLTWAKSSRNPIRILTSFQFDPDKLICMRAVEGLGVIAPIYNRKLETLRKMVRSYFWNMNDESGNVGWFSPEAIGETLRNVPALIDEYAGMLPQFLIEEPFERGTRIAIARVAEIDKSKFGEPTCKKLIQSLKNANPEIRATSITTLKVLGCMDAKEHVAQLMDDSTEVELYDFECGLYNIYTIKQLAESY